MKQNQKQIALSTVFIFLAALYFSGCAASDTASRSAGGGAILGTLLGAAAGAAIGAATGNPGLGAAIGAGAGALTGATTGYAAGQRHKELRASGYYPPPVPDYINAIGSPRWNGNVWVISNQYGTMWWNENEERWQY